MIPTCVFGSTVESLNRKPRHASSMHGIIKQRKNKVKGVLGYQEEMPEMVEL